MSDRPFLYARKLQQIWNNLTNALWQEWAGHVQHTERSLPMATPFKGNNTQIHRHARKPTATHRVAQINRVPSATGSRKCAEHSSQGNAVTRFRCGGIANDDCYRFIAASDGDRIFKIDRRLAKLRAREQRNLFDSWPMTRVFLRRCVDDKEITTSTHTERQISAENYTNNIPTTSQTATQLCPAHLRNIRAAVSS